ncbi:MAG TPA: hypothetical protein VFC07_15390 [Verrucomicrobiae bacterium]|nr:hypothetical protein [Verrucomicrobiae bacterium]
MFILQLGAANPLVTQSGLMDENISPKGWKGMSSKYSTSGIFPINAGEMSDCASGLSGQIRFGMIELVFTGLQVWHLNTSSHPCHDRNGSVAAFRILMGI